MTVRLFMLSCLIFFSAQLTADVLDSLLIVLDETIENHSSFSEPREQQIRELKQKLHASKNPSERYDIQKQLYKEYKPYRCDSAIHYLNLNISLASAIGNRQAEDENKLLLAYQLASAGMYLEATDILNTIAPGQLTEKLLTDYYVTWNHVCQEAATYSQDPISSARYRAMEYVYRDSVFERIDKESPRFIEMSERMLRESGRYNEALLMNDKRMSATHFGTPEYAMVSFERSLIFRALNERDEEKTYLALSSLSDIRLAIKDHASLWLLAQRLYEEGDIERAYRYIRFSWSETVFYNARLRSMQSAGILSLIDKTYHALTEQKNRQLSSYLYWISALGILLAIALFFIYRQMKKLAIARNNLQVVNGQLRSLNEELRHTNNRLSSTNVELSESNHIKEEYIGRFIKLCSTYIDKLDGYRRMVNKKIANGKTDELYKMTRSQNALDDELRELYSNFDTAFLQLFPGFVDEFNKLLLPDEQIRPKSGELLSTELRIFALIRLGIDDSSQIAEFLRYSVNTIYNYRAKVKNKACVSRDDFEDMVRKIR